MLSAKEPTAEPAGGQVSGQIRPTPLSAALGLNDLWPFAGAYTSPQLDGPAEEMASLLSGAGLSDLGWRAKVQVVGQDGLRWLNGMVSNTVQALAVNEGNYSFLLNAQGRIHGDCYVYRRANDLLLDTSRSQLTTLLSHLDHYIIMDDVELRDVSEDWTALGLAGPRAMDILTRFGLKAESAPPLSGTSPRNALLGSIKIGNAEVTVVEAYHVLVPQYELWFAPAEVLTVWEGVKQAGAKPIGLETREDLRVLEGIHLYGVDLSERDLPQESGQARALSFTKGCYLGQEIVERIRSRGKVHRQLRQFRLTASESSSGSGPVSSLPLELLSGSQTAGQITSITSGRWTRAWGLGIVREEAAQGNTQIRYEGGTAVPLAKPPSLAEIESQ